MPPKTSVIIIYICFYFCISIILPNSSIEESCYLVAEQEEDGLPHPVLLQSPAQNPQLDSHVL